MPLAPNFWTGTNAQLVRMAKDAYCIIKGCNGVPGIDPQAVILTPPMIRPGMHLNAVGGDCPGKTELHSDVLRMTNARVFVEYEPQSRIEGEIQQMDASFPVVEFADVVSGRTPARTRSDQITIFDSVGFALEDYSALRFLHSLLEEQRSARRQIDLVPTLEDPKDLFGGTLGGGLARGRLRKTA